MPRVPRRATDPPRCVPSYLGTAAPSHHRTATKLHLAHQASARYPGCSTVHGDEFQLSDPATANRTAVCREKQPSGSGCWKNVKQNLRDWHEVPARLTNSPSTFTHYAFDFCLVGLSACLPVLCLAG